MKTKYYGINRGKTRNDGAGPGDPIGKGKAFGRAGAGVSESSNT